uniref:Uncharacterized protein n=1 Tax=Moschus moschiferus TaxID=68415 RepID=A0A8C6CU95_MOSMO
FTAHLKSDQPHFKCSIAFSPRLGNGDHQQGRPQPGWVDSRTWMSFQGPPGGSGIRPGLVPSARCGGFPRVPHPMTYAEGWPTVRRRLEWGWFPEASWRAPQPKGKAGARVESNSEGASPGPLMRPFPWRLSLF